MKKSHFMEQQDQIFPCQDKIQLVTFPRVFKVTEQKAYKNATLSRIDFHRGQILFDYDADRIDLDGGKRLNRVQIYEKLPNGTVAAVPMKEYVLSYGYFTGVGDNDFNDPNGNNADYLYKRLKTIICARGKS